MKYQVYLNKETSLFINKLAKETEKKPNTVIKEIIEDFVTLTKPLEAKIIEEVKNGRAKTSIKGEH